MATSTTTGYMSYATTEGYNAQDLTLEAWVYVRTAGSSYIIEFEPTTAAYNFGVALRISASGGNFDLHATQTNSGGSTFANIVTSGGSTPLKTHKWYHVCAVLPTGWTTTPSLAKLYVNGSLATTDTSGSTSTGAANSLSGTVYLFNGYRNGSFNRQLDGLISRARVWKRALSAGEVAEAYGATTDALTAAISCISSLALEFRGDTAQTMAEYVAYPEWATLTPTVTGTVTTPNLAAYSITNKLCLLYDANGGCYSDTGLTTLLSASSANDGSSGGCKGIKDLTLCGNNATQSTQANLADFYTDGAGNAWLSVSKPSYNAKYAIGGTSKLDARNLTISMVGRWCMPYSSGGSGTSLFSTTSGEVMCQCESDGRLSGSNNAVDMHGTDSEAVYVWVFGASSIKIYRNGTLLSTTAASAATDILASYLMANLSGGETFDGTIRKFFVWQDTQLSEAQVQAWTTERMAEAGIVAKTVTVFEDGSSSQYGSSATHKQNRAWRLNQIAGLKHIQFINVALGGETLSTMNTGLTAVGTMRTKERATAPSVPCKLWIQGGANDAADGAAALTAMQTYLATAITQGFSARDILIHLILPANTATLSGNQTEMDIFNTGLKSLGYRYADSTPEPHFSRANYQADGYYASGFLHLNDAGHGLECTTYLAPRIKRWMREGQRRRRRAAALVAAGMLG